MVMFFDPFYDIMAVFGVVSVGLFGVEAQRRAGSINFITVVGTAAAAAFVAAVDGEMRFGGSAALWFTGRGNSL